MKLLFTHEQHTVMCEGMCYTKGLIGYSAMKNYLTHIPNGILVVRQQRKEVSFPKSGWLKVDGPGISLVPIPDVQTVKSMILCFPQIFNSVRKASKKADRFFIRMPGIAGMAVGFSLCLLRKQFAMELVGHPTESVKEMLAQRGQNASWMLRLLDRFTRYLVKKSVAVAYRSDYLRQAFPSNKSDNEFIISGAQILSEYITQPRSREQFLSHPFTFVSIGRINPEKGYLCLLEAFAKVCKESSDQVRLRIIGDGTDLPKMKERALDLGIEQHCEFLGRIQWGDDLFSALDNCHLFLLPSLTEGMPRSLIEAMARGMPALGSRCGGIPELLDEQYLVKPGDADAWAEAMSGLIDKATTLEAMSRTNFEKSEEHWPQQLQKEKDAFWEKVIRDAK
jgi:glycosyltransferase involved in cell wall biosynthesis